MSKPFAANEILLRQLLLEDGQAVDPSTSGFAAPIGSMFVEHGTYPTTPTDTWLKSGAGNTEWLKQNLTGIRTFNVKDPIYGAVGDGVADDLIPINLAIAACQAAGGGIVYLPPGNYRITKNSLSPLFATPTYVSITLSDANNVTIMGDGDASKLVFADTTGDVRWWAIGIFNGTTNLTFVNVAFDGMGMITGAAFGNVIAAVTADAAVRAPSKISLYDCTLGPAVGGPVAFNGVNDPTRINNIRVSRCTVDSSQSTGTGGGASGLDVRGFVNHLLVMRTMGIHSATNKGNCFALTETGFSIPAEIWDWRCDRNHIACPDVLAGSFPAVIASGGSFSHNTASLANRNVASSTGGVMAHRDVRGNVIVKTDGTSSLSILTPGTMTVQNSSISVRGNVVCQTDGTSAQTSAMSVGGMTGQGVCAITDNIVESGSTAAINVVQMNLVGNVSTVMNGNIVACTNCGAGVGSGLAVITATGVAGPPVQVADGNLIVMTATAVGAMIHALSLHSASAGQNTRVTEVSFNLAFGTQRTINLGTANRSEWIAAGGNNHVTSGGTLDINPPAGNAGFTAMANAGASPQVMVSGATMIGNVPVSKGSLGINTAGGQGTTLFYKQTDDGTPAGGTAGWFGICGYELTFGTLAGSTTATALFYAGGMGQASPSATEIQYPMPRPGTLRNLRFRCVAGTGGGTCTFVVRKNGVNTAITIAPLNTATSASDTTNSAAVVRGDLISFQVTKSGTITTAQTLSRAVLELAS